MNELKLKDVQVIAQADDNDYQESGYVVVLDKSGVYHIGSYSHCSCYGTWDGGDYGSGHRDGVLSGSWLWEGSGEELVKLAKERRDPSMPERPADSKDYDYSHLIDVYEQVLRHFGN